jgi:maltooligosyltrehalose synthase
MELSKLIDPDNRKHEDFLPTKRALEVSGIAFMTCAQDLEEAIRKMKAGVK